MKFFKKNKSKDLPRRRSNTLVKNTTISPINIFKRNRTLTGTTSNRLDSTNAKSDLESPRVHAHKLLIQRRKIFSILLIIIVMTVPVLILVCNFTANVSVSSSQSGLSKSIDVKKYENAILSYLDINPISRIMFFMDRSLLTDYVSNKLPEVLSVSSGSMIGLGKTNFSITMRAPVAGWQINSKQYYVDAKGIPFERNYFSDPTVQIVDNSGVSLAATGTTAIASNRFLSFVGKVVTSAKASGYTVTQASLPVNTTRELLIKIGEGNYLVKLSIDRLAGEQVEDMVAAIKYFASRGQVPEYIDVRVSGKAFFK